MQLRLLTLAVALIAAPAFAQDKPRTGFVDAKFKNKDGSESPYVVFVPHSYDPEKQLPVILFLHGSGETKGGTKMPIDVGLPPAIKKMEKTFEFITIIPQSEKRTWQATSDDGKRAVAILDEVMKKYNGDPKRVYLTGLSMGGFGTWSMAAAFPDRWAAIAPVCGGGDTSKAETIKDIPCWNFHGDADTAVKVDLSRKMIEALKAAGGKPKYTEYPGVPHNSWDKAYDTKELYTWLLEQKKK